MELPKIDFSKWVRGMKLGEGLKHLFDPEHAEENKSEIHSVAEKGVEIAEKVKAWINNPVAQFALDFAPGWAKETVNVVNGALPVIVAGLTGFTNPKDFPAALAMVKFSPNYYWDKFFHDLATGISNALADGKFSYADLGIAVQIVKDNIGSKVKK